MSLQHLHRYRVDAERHVGSPGGPWTTTVLKRDFPFGKGKLFPNGDAARQAAVSFAKTLLPEASRISVWKMHGFGARGEYLKNEPQERFPCDWDGVSVPEGGLPAN